MHGKYSNLKLGYEVNLPPGVVCARSETNYGCGFSSMLRLAESEWKTDSLPARYMWASGEINNGSGNEIDDVRLFHEFVSGFRVK